MEAEAAVGEGARLFCPNPRCSQLLIADDKRADTPLDCPYCAQRVCAQCGVAWHKGLTCNQYQVRG
jgi:E3 ubiquitin-protein ligase RNF144